MNPPLQDELATLRSQAVALAGSNGDLAQRAAVYRHLYRHSGGNHAFPLLAAHGALWASGYFRRNLSRAEWATRLLPLLGADGANRRRQVHALAEAFRDINRRICVETWFLYQLTGSPALTEAAAALVPGDLAAPLARCHAARRSGTRLAPADRRELFEAFFRWEQATIVGPAVADAFARFDWPLARARALRPRIAFAYLDAPLPFRDFGNTGERIEKGLAAFDAGNRVGWDRVEESLASYGILPNHAVAAPAAHFRTLVRQVSASFTSPTLSGAAA